MSRERPFYERLVCKSGFSMSIQASEYSYCYPRSDTAESYESVEVGFPNQIEPLLDKYCEDERDPTGTVYPYVPVWVVTTVIAKHGGVVSGTAPPGVLMLEGD